MAQDLSQALHVRQIDDGELILLITSEFSASQQTTALEVVYGTPAVKETPGSGVKDISFDSLDRDFALKVIYRKDNAVERIVRGPGLTDEALSRLTNRIDTDLRSGKNKVWREILLSEKPVCGHFSGGHFQILPMPLNAPRAGTGYLAGINARHPCILEFQFTSSPNDHVRSFRAFRLGRDVALTLSALLEGSIHLGRMSSRQHWVTRPPSPENAGTIEFLSEGYGYGGFPSESNEFSQIAGLPPLAAVEPQTYYTHVFSQSVGSLRVPSDLTERFKRSQGLAPEDRSRWLRACYWSHHSSDVVGYSFSAAYAALVLAIDALIPKEGKKKKSDFKSFVESHAQQTIGAGPLYGVRSDVLHGNHLLMFDRDPLPSGMTPGMNKARDDFEAMRQVARRVLVGWLEQT